MFAEYAKHTPNDILINITVANRGPDTARLHVLPTLWFRNTWIWGCKHEGCTCRPSLTQTAPGIVECQHNTLGRYTFAVDVDQDDVLPELLFTENETNSQVRHFRLACPQEKCFLSLHDTTRLILVTLNFRKFVNSSQQSLFTYFFALDTQKS